MKKQLLMKFLLTFFIAFVLVNFTPLNTQAQDTPAPETDDSFDPFSDYNEFEQETEEEADINFLRNGRYLTLGLLAGYRGFTEGFAEGYEGSLNYGIQLSYFFDLNLATSFSYTTGDHGIYFESFNTNGTRSREYNGTVNIQIFDIHVKYYINTDNVTKGLADLNPYALVGAGMFVRTYNIDQIFLDDPDRVPGFRLGGGIEFPIVQRRFYIGAQVLFDFVQFPDENNDFIDEGAEDVSDPKAVRPNLNGDIYEINLILGTNF